MTPHCTYCADPWRAVILALVAKGIRPVVISRHYGLRPTSVVSLVAEAQKRHCIPRPRCRYCPAYVTRYGGCCQSKRCDRLYGRDYMRERRATGRHTARLGRQQYPEPEGFEWPALPRNPRERTLRRPPRRKPKPSGMLILPRVGPPTMKPSGFAVVGVHPTSPIGTTYFERAA